VHVRTVSGGVVVYFGKHAMERPAVGGFGGQPEWDVCEVGRVGRHPVATVGLTPHGLDGDSFKSNVLECLNSI
jgi:hypothetical protein